MEKNICKTLYSACIGVGGCIAWVPKPGSPSRWSQTIDGALLYDAIPSRTWSKVQFQHYGLNGDFFCIFTPQFGKLSRGLLPYRFVSLFSLPIVLLVIIYNMVSTLKSDKNNSKTNSIGIVKHVPEGLVDWQCVIN